MGLRDLRAVLGPPETYIDCPWLRLGRLKIAEIILR